MKSTRSLLFKRLLYVLGFFSLFFLFSIQTKANAQESVTGLGYVDTKTFQRQVAAYYPFREVFDSNNNLYIVGEMTEDYPVTYVDPTIDLDWNSGISNYQGTYYVAKYSPQRQLLWGMTLGSIAGSVGAGGIAIDSNNNLYLSGDFTGTIDFDPTSGVDSRTSVSAQDAFITKINANGTYGWTKTWGGNQYDYVYNLAIDSARNALYATGWLYSTNVDLDPGAGTDVEAKSGFTISKFDLDGNYQWGNAYGNKGGLSNQFIYVKQSTGDVYMGSRIYAQTIDFDPGAGTDNITGSATAAFITKLSSSNTYLGTILLTGFDMADFVFDSSENIYITGRFSGTVDFNPSGSVDSITSNGSTDVFISKWNASVNPFVLDVPYAWTKKIGGTSGERAFALATDAYNNVYVGGTFSGTNVDFDYSSGTDLQTSVGSNTWSFMSLIKTNGDYVKTYSWGGSNTNKYGWTDILDINVDSQGRVYAYGSYYEDTDFDPSTNRYILKGADNSNNDYNYDAYVSIFYPYISSAPGNPGVFGIPGETYSSDSTLSALTTSEGAVSPTFTPATSSYSKDVTGGVEALTLTATTSDTTSKLAINGYAITSGVASNLMGLRNGANTITVTVWPQNNSSVSTYTLTVNKPLPDGSYYVYDDSKQIGDPSSNLTVDKSLIDANGNYYISGFFSAGPVNFGVASEGDAMIKGQFLLKLDANQNPVWVYRWVNDSNNGLPYVYIFDMALDSTGALYAVGGYQGTVDLNPTAVTDSRPSGGTQDAFMIKINTDASIAYIYSWGGNSVESANSIAIDSTDNIYVGGDFYSTTDFDPTAGTNSITNTNGNIHGFISKFATNGTYGWTKTFETTNNTSYPSVGVGHIAVDSQGNIFAAGDFDGTNIDFDPGVGTDLKTAVDGATYLTKINANGTYGWTKVTIDQDWISLDDGDLIVDNTDKIIITGSYSADSYSKAYLDPDNPTVEYPSVGTTDDIFLQKYNNDGSIVWVKTFGSTSWDYPQVLGVNSDNNLFVGGWYDGAIDFNPSLGEDIINPPYGNSAYLTQINNQNTYVWTYSFDSNYWAEIYGINFTENGDLFVIGSMEGTTDLNPESGVDSYTVIGTSDIFIARFTPLVFNNANLSALETSEGILIPDFNANTTSYTVVLDSDVSSITVKPTAEDQNITGIDVNGSAVTSGQFSGNIPLNPGNNTITITITAGDGTTTKVYTINAWRDNGGTAPFSVNTKLSALSTSVGTLSPTFSSNTRSYIVDVASNVSTIKVTPTLEDTNAYRLTVNGSIVQSGQQSQAIGLNAGVNTITVSVIAEDRRTLGSYTVNVNRDDSPYTPGLKPLWAKNGLNTNSSIYPTALCADSLGNTYTIGYFSGSNINLGYPDGNAIFSVASGTNDDFVIKRNANGDFQWAKVLSGTFVAAGMGNWDEAFNTCAVDDNDNLYIGGYWNGTINLNLSGGTDTKTALGVGDGFLSKYDSSGNYVYSYIFPSTDVNRPEQVRTVAVTSQSIYIAGSMYAGDFDMDGTAGVDNQGTIAHGDGFISKYTISGTYLGGMRILGPNYDEEPNLLAVDANDNVYLAGYWNGPTMDFDSSAGVDSKTGTGTREIFLTKFDNNLGYDWTRIIYGSGSQEFVRGISLDDEGNVYVVGNTDYWSNIQFEGDSTIYSSLYPDAYVVKYLPDGTHSFTKMLASDQLEAFYDIEFLNNKFYLAGEFRGNLDFDMSSGTAIKSSAGGNKSLFIEILDEDFNYMNALTFDTSIVSGDYLASQGDNLFLLATGDRQRDNISATYKPFNIDTGSTYSYHPLLVKYLEQQINMVINTDPELSFTEQLLGQPISSILFLPDDAPDVTIMKNPPAENSNIQEQTSSTVYEGGGTYFNAGDDDYWQYDLPFAFPFYDQVYNSMSIGTNGMICFDLNVDCDWYPDDGLDDTYYGPFIAPLGFDTETDTKEGDGIFVDASDQSVTVRWKGIEYGEDTVMVEFSLTMYPNGEFDFKYGPQSMDFTYNETYIGVGAGDGVRYTQASNMTQFNYNNAPSLHWIPADSPVLVADTSVDMSRTRNWVNLSADVDKVLRKSLTVNLDNAPGVTSYDMYVPYAEGQNISRIVVCPNATTLSDITLDCPYGQSVRVGDTGVSEFTYLGKPYIKLAGYGSLGAMISNSNSFTVYLESTKINEGDSTSITIVVNDTVGNIDTGYTGTVNITTNIPGLPTQYTFTPEDGGIHVFSNITIQNKGTYGITVEDSLDSQVLGVSDSILVEAVVPPVIPPVNPPVDPPVYPPVYPPVEPPVDPDDGGDTPTDPGTDEPPVIPPTDNPGDNNDGDTDNNGDDTTTGIVEGLTNIIDNVIEGFIQLITEGGNSKLVQAPITFIKNIPVSVDTTQTISYGSLGLVVTTTLLPTTIGASYPMAYLFQFSSMLLAGLKIRKKTRGYGVVYDSVTKEPINRAIVRVFDKAGKLMSTEVTNVYGAFDVNLPQGEYIMKVLIRTHVYPSALIQGNSDSPYENVYHGQVFTHNPGEPVAFSIPVDPIDKNFVQYAGVTFRNKLLSLLSYTQYILVVVGFFFVLTNYIKEDKPLNLALLLFYILMMLVNFYIWYKDRKQYGVVKDTSGNPVQGATIALREMEFETIYGKRVTDDKGRYRFLVPGGKYKVETLNQGLSIIPSTKLTYEGKKEKIMTINPNLTLRKSE